MGIKLVRPPWRYDKPASDRLIEDFLSGQNQQRKWLGVSFLDAGFDLSWAISGNGSNSKLCSLVLLPS